ncbi:hypothetical protein [Streptomyces sp. NPDC023838]|uniref:hypothetical protein n=1 Tax=Streptomyces sp. NPDC023838 TaxID=3154325 RepID=UPI0033F43013
MSRLERAASRLVHGAALLARRVTDRAAAWVRAGRRRDLTGWQAELGVWLRAALLLAGLWILWRIVRAAPAVLWGLAALLGIAAWRSGRPLRPSPAPAAAAVEEPLPEADDKPVRAVSDAELFDLIRRAAGRGKGAHLSTLAERLTTATGQAWTTGDVRAVLDQAGVPVSGSVRGPDRRVSTGVRLDALPDPAPAPPVAQPVAVVDAGQDPATGAATTTATAELREIAGVRMEIRNDPEQPARTHVRVIKTGRHSAT